MNNFEGAALVPGGVCREALEAFAVARNEFIINWKIMIGRLKEEKTVSKVFLIFAHKETKWDAVLRMRDNSWYCPEETAMKQLGFITKDQYRDWDYYNDHGWYMAKSVKQLTNNGIRDAYLNPEQAAFVNRWGK